MERTTIQRTMSALAETSRDRLRGDTFEALAVVTQRTDAKSQRYGPAHGGMDRGGTVQVPPTRDGDQPSLTWFRALLYQLCDTLA